MNSSPYNLLLAQELGRLPIHGQYFAYADAYLDSASRLCVTLCRSTKKASFERGAVVLYLTQHALELFFKGAILKNSPKERFSHGLVPLQNRYKALYPAKRFHITEYFQSKFDGLSEDEIAQLQGLEPPSDQLYRYPEDKKGRPWRGLFAFEASSFRKDLENLRAEIQRARSHIEA